MANKLIGLNSNYFLARGTVIFRRARRRTLTYRGRGLFRAALLFASKVHWTKRLIGLNSTQPAPAFTGLIGVASTFVLTYRMETTT
jgi:hypothetical protein